MTVSLADELDGDRLTVNSAESPKLLSRVSRCLDDLLGDSRGPGRRR